jgi:hypothetical protein
MSPFVQFFFEGSSPLDDSNMDEWFQDGDAENILLMFSVKELED